MAPILLIFFRMKLTRVYACHFLYMYFPDRGCVHTLLTLCVYATDNVFHAEGPATVKVQYVLHQHNVISRSNFRFQPSPALIRHAVLLHGELTFTNKYHSVEYSILQVELVLFSITIPAVLHQSPKVIIGRMRELRNISLPHCYFQWSLNKQLFRTISLTFVLLQFSYCGLIK